MGDTMSDHDTFVSMEKYVYTTQPSPRFEDQQNPDSRRSSDGDLFLNEGVYVDGNPVQDLSTGHASSHPHPQPSLQMEDHSAFMWNLYAPDADATVDVDASDNTLEVPGDAEDTPDPSDLCGEFNTSAMSRSKPFARTQNPHSQSNDRVVSSTHQNQAHTHESQQGNFRETVVDGDAPNSAGLPNEHAQMESIGASYPKQRPSSGQCIGSPERTEEVLLNATKGIISYRMENPFLCSAEQASQSPAVVLYSSMGSLTRNERSFWNSVTESPTSPESLVMKRLVETVQFQQKQVQDLKAAEMQIASATLQSERRRHSEVEHERSAAIATLMEQLSEEGEYRANLEEENAKLRTALMDVQNQNDEVLNYFAQFDKDFTFSGGVENALKGAHQHLEDAHQRDEEQIREQQQKVEEVEGRLYEAETISEEHLRKSTRLERLNKKLEAELRSFKEDLRDLPSTQPSTAAFLSEEALTQERDDLKHHLRDLEREMEQLKSSLRSSRAEQNRVNDALLSMNVELEDSKRRFNTLRKQRDSAERKHRDLMETAASDRDRFYKFQSEMSVNFANAVNEIEDRQAQVGRLENELEEREKAFQMQASTVTSLQEQLQTIINSVIEQDSTNRDERKKDQGEKSKASLVVRSMKEEITKAQMLLKERGEEIEGLRKQLYSNNELLSSVQRECAKLRTAASVRKLTARMSQGPSVRMEEHQSAFLRRLSEKLRSEPKEDGEVLKRLTQRIDILSNEKGRFEEAKQTLVGEVKQREHALHALRAEMAAEIATLKADVRHQETLRIRAQDNFKALEKKYQELLDTRKVTGRESFGDLTSSSVGIRDWSHLEDGDGDSRRESMYSTIHDEHGIRWKDPIIEEAVRSLNALIGTKDELWAKNRELREKLESILKTMGISDEEGRRLRALLMQSKDFQDELTRIVDMQQDILGNITGSAFDRDQSAGVDDTLPYLREELSPRSRAARNSETGSHAIKSDGTGMNGSVPALQKTRGEAAQFLREQLNETRAHYNEKLKVNVQLCGLINELKQEVNHLKTSNCDLESALSGMNETHEGFVSRLALLAGTEQSAIAIEDYMRTVMHKVTDLRERVSNHEERENLLTRRVTCLIAQKHVLTHIIDIYQSKYKLDILATTSAIGSSHQRFRKCATAVIAVARMSQVASSSAAKPLTIIDVATLYDVPALAAIGRRRTRTTSLHSVVIAVEAMPRLERALVEKNEEVIKLQGSVKGLERSLAALTESAKTVTHELPTSFLYKDDIMNRKNDMARRLRDIIQEKEDLDERLSREKQGRLAAEAKSTRYLDKLSILKRKLGKTISQAESKERTYKAAIIYLKDKAEKANDNHGELDENVDPCPTSRQFYGLSGDMASKRKPSLAESRAVLEQELGNAEMELVNLEVGSEEYEKKSQYIKGLYGGIQRLGKPMLSDHSAQAPVVDHGDQRAR